MKKINEDLVFDIVNVILICMILIITIYPLYFVIIASFSEPYEVAKGNILLWPKGLTLEAYTNVFKNSEVWVGYRNTIFYTVFATLFGLFLTVPSAYVLSKSDLPGRKIFTWSFIFIMYFNGGLIPTYLLIKDLGLIDKPFTLIVIGAFSVFNLIITRTYFMTSIPNSLYEVAYIDGASEIKTFIKIALPLSGPIIAVISLYFIVAHWNAFFAALIYLNKKEYMPLQIILRNILIQNQSMIKSMQMQGTTSEEMQAAARMAYMAEAIKYSLIIVASIPLLIIYPFVQKFFVKGVMLGSLKG